MDEQRKCLLEFERFYREAQANKANAVKDGFTSEYYIHSGILIGLCFAYRMLFDISYAEFFADMERLNYLNNL